MPLRRETAYGAGDFPEEEAGFSGRDRRGVRISFRNGLIPRTMLGRIVAGGVLLLTSGMVIVAGVAARRTLLRDTRFTIPDAQAIEVAGTSHLTRAQLLSIFGEDVDRNLFAVPLEQRQAELERLPWVEQATVMRLLPDHLRVAVVERTPVAFVREGPQIGLVDANGVLFDMPSPEMVAADGGKVPHYSFPVLTGISANDPLSVRAARMKIFMGFMTALDAGGEKISSKLSEVDVSDPEDVRAVIPEPGGADMLVHFGEEKFLERYQAFQQHLAEWRTQYPRLASADMRYERQVVLGMKPDFPAGNDSQKMDGTESKSPDVKTGTSTGTQAPTQKVATVHDGGVKPKSVATAAHANNSGSSTVGHKAAHRSKPVAHAGKARKTR
ncbi:MAG TPA: FtsQ-type POTRA domain-containing protein [Acidobacteriaceae bacterium]|nr:FtsQ-type POTRA domain-containing protein [Acidobacteriaceae bacterium]